MWQRVVEGFRGAGLGLKLVEAPFQRNSQIFQMDIHDGRSGEYFRIWPGARGNVVEVLDGDPRLRQVVLRVQEARRRFLETLTRFPGRERGWAEAQAARVGGRIVREALHQWTVERWTPEEERRFLCGADESRLFIAQVRQGETVPEAHAALKPEEVVDAEEKAPGVVRRQGEWFFLPASFEDEEQIRAYAATHPRALEREAAIGRGGTPHVADSVVRVDRRERRGGRELRLPEVYAVGWVRHPDHAALHLERWHKAVHNAEVAQPSLEERRVRWID